MRTWGKEKFREESFENHHPGQQTKERMKVPYGLHCGVGREGLILETQGGSKDLLFGVRLCALMKPIKYLK